MDLTTFSGILCLIATFAYFIYNRGKQKEGWPPGPWRLPLIGNAHQLGMAMHRPFAKWAKEYGPVFYAKLGPMDLIVLSDPKMLKEAFANPIFAGKPNREEFLAFSKGKYGIIATDGDAWSEQRRFTESYLKFHTSQTNFKNTYISVARKNAICTMRHLRDFGLGKSKMEPLIMDEVKDVIQWLKAEEGKPVSLSSRFNLAVLNSLWMIMNGQRYKHDDPKLVEIFNQYNESMAALSSSAILFSIPVLVKLFPNASGWNKLWKVVDAFHSFFRESIVEHEATVMDDPRDFVDAYLNEMKSQVKSTSSFNEENGMKHLLAVMGDLFAAGYETTSTTLTWLFLYLSVNPSALKKFQDEIETVIGTSRQPTLADRPNMVYTEALISELLRITSIVPFGTFHKATQDTTLNNCRIKKDVFVCSNLYYIHNNPDIWGDPQNFRPERFISEDGKTFVKNENLMAFSTGKRNCIGETLARDEIFLFGTSICQRFDIQPDPQNPNPSTEPQDGFVLAAKPYTLIMKDRML